MVASLVFLCLAIAVTDKITVAGKVVFETVVSSVGRNLDLSSVDSKWLNYRGCEVLCIDEQSRRIECVVHVGKEDLDVGDGDECRASSKCGDGEDGRRGGCRRVLATRAVA